MAYLLSGLTLPNPKKLSKRVVEQSVEHLLMFGKTTKKVQNRKFQYVLQYVYLTQAQINAILAKFELEQVLLFSCTDEFNPITETEVLMNIKNLHYPPSGELWLEDMEIILTEVI